MSSLDSERIYLLYDETDDGSAPTLSNSIAVSAVAMNTLSSQTLQCAAAVVVDADLSNLDTVKRLREALTGTGVSAPRIFAVEHDKRMHAHQVQANALGASRILRRPLKPAEVRLALEELGVQVAPPIPTGILAEPGGASIMAAATLLDDAFRALNANAPLDVKKVLSAGRQLLSGVSDAGLSSWLDTVRAHHEGTFQHCLIVAGTVVAYAKEAKLPEQEQLALTVAALLHDIGKAAVPLDILDKPGKLNQAEFEIMKTHPMIARDYLVAQRKVPSEVIRVVASHHELLDGSGYPQQLRGDQINPLTRILTVCDIYGALVERRSYKSPKTAVEAIMILVEMAGLGKVEYRIVRILGSALGVNLPQGQIFVTSAD